MGPVTFAVADQNFDHKADLVLAGTQNATKGGAWGITWGIGVSLGNGDGTFQPAVFYQPPVTLVLVRPFITALQTRPCRAQPHMGVSSPPRPWLSQLNHSQASPSSLRFGVHRTLSPRLP